MNSLRDARVPAALVAKNRTVHIDIAVYIQASLMRFIPSSRAMLMHANDVTLAPTSASRKLV